MTFQGKNSLGNNQDYTQEIEAWEKDILNLTSETSKAIEKNIQEVYYKWPRKTILIAEDDNDIWNVLKELLELYGFIVTLVLNGEEAVKYIENKLPDIVIMDQLMPILN